MMPANEKIYSGSADKLRDPERIQLLEVPEVVRHCLDSSIRSVLDVGTGSGLFAEAFVKKGLEVRGIDLNPGMISEAQKRVPQAFFKQGAMEKIPYADISFDLVFFGLVLHETDALETVIQEAFRVSRKRAAFLEWPYLEEEKGPPLAHRLRADQIIEILYRTGFISADVIPMRHMVLLIAKKS